MIIQPLSKKTLKQASELTIKIFKDRKPEDSDYPPMWFKVSLKKGKKFYEGQEVTYLQYWVAIDEKSKRVIGTVGLYGTAEDKADAFWLGWFCVDPNFRGQKIGSTLLNTMIEKARNSGKKYLRLYTSTDPNEATAQILYDKRGFKITKKEKQIGKKYLKVYKELILR